jgi:hypothetical protein
MSATRLYRISAVLFVLFVAGHTFGFFGLQPPTADSAAVWSGMNNVHFNIGNATFSYGEFYRGSGLTITVYLLFSAFLSWRLGSIAAKWPQAIGWLGWVFCGAQVAGIVLAAMYFPAPPLILSILLTVSLGWAAMKVRAA